MGIGEFSALLAALLWTVSSMLWRRLHLSAWEMNLSKNIIGSMLLAAHLLVSAWLSGTVVFEASTASIGYLAISGIVGVIVGDTLFFRSLQILGPRRALMVATISPLFAVVLGWAVLNEQLMAITLLGIFLTMAGVIAVVADRKANAESPNVFPGQNSVGAMLGIGGALCQAIGGILSRIGMQDCSGLEASFYRVCIAAVVMIAIFFLRGSLGHTLRSAMTRQNLRLLVPATIVGTWMGIWLSQMAYKYSDAGIAQTLLSTCPLFAVPIVYYVDRQKISLLSLVGSIIAIVGVYLVVQNSG